MGKTTAEKIFEAHLVDEPFPGTKVLRLDVVLCHEITTPIAIDDLIRRGKDRVFDPTKIKAVIDHVTPSKDTKTATQAKILRDWARRHGIKDFFDVGANGVCHALFPEKGFIRPGYTVIMGDSHTCTHGAFGAFAAGIGTTDLEVGILKGVCAFRQPKTIQFNVNGALPKGVYAKDVILHIIGKIGVNGATDRVMEFHGSTIDAMTMESRMTLCNMAIEAGGTSGICMPDMTTVEYLWPFIKDEFASKEAALADYSQWRADADADYDQVIEIDVTALQPVVTFGYKPDQVKFVTEMPDSPIDQVYLGSCTNGRLEDLRIAAADPERAQTGPERARHPLAGNPEDLAGGHARGADRHLHGSRLLRHQPDLRRLPGHEQRRTGRGRGLRLHHQPQLHGQDGQRGHGAPDVTGHGGSQRHRRQDRRPEEIPVKPLLPQRSQRAQSLTLTFNKRDCDFDAALSPLCPLWLN